MDLLLDSSNGAELVLENHSPGTKPHLLVYHRLSLFQKKSVQYGGRCFQSEASVRSKVWDHFLFPLNTYMGHEMVSLSERGGGFWVPTLNPRGFNEKLWSCFLSKIDHVSFGRLSWIEFWSEERKASTDWHCSLYISIVNYAHVRAAQTSNQIGFRQSSPRLKDVSWDIFTHEKSWGVCCGTVGSKLICRGGEEMVKDENWHATQQ